MLEIKATVEIDIKRNRYWLRFNKGDAQIIHDRGAKEMDKMDEKDEIEIVGSDKRFRIWWKPGGKSKPYLIARNNGEWKFNNVAYFEVKRITNSSMNNPSRNPDKVTFDILKEDPLKLSPRSGPPPNLYANDLDESPTNRVETTTNRIIRDTKKAQDLKKLHENKCQICNLSIELLNQNFYSEAHHIKPLGEPHNGPDVKENILILCPNHHARCDYFAIELKLSKIRTHSDHQIDQRFIDYHNEQFHTG